MAELRNAEYHPQVFYRLTALWAFCEAFAGGIMHGFKLPFTGLIISSLAVTCIMMIAYYVPGRSAILKATLLVAILKLMLSPHSPPTAYIAVFFQGLMGYLLLYKRSFFKTGSILLAILALVESAIQRLLVLVIVYGNNLWKALDIFIQKLLQDKSTGQYSFYIAGSYVLLHAVIGVFTGLFAYKLIKRSEYWKTEQQGYLFTEALTEDEENNRQVKRHKKPRLIFIFTWLILAGLLAWSAIYPGHSLVPGGIIASMLLRSIMIILSWHLFLSPLIMYFIRRAMKQQQQKHDHEVRQVMFFIPETRKIFRRSLQLSEGSKGLDRLKLFLKILVINVLYGR